MVAPDAARAMLPGIVLGLATRFSIAPVNANSVTVDPDGTL